MKHQQGSYHSHEWTLDRDVPCWKCPRPYCPLGSGSLPNVRRLCIFLLSPTRGRELPGCSPGSCPPGALTPPCNPHPRFAQEARVTNDMAEVLLRPFRGEVIKDPGASFLSLALPPDHWLWGTPGAMSWGHWVAQWREPRGEELRPFVQQPVRSRGRLTTTWVSLEWRPQPPEKPWACLPQHWLKSTFFTW